MPRRIVQTAERNYLFSPDDSPPAADRLSALAKVRLIDELSGGPPAGAVRLTSQQRGVTVRLTEDGIGGAVGIPRVVFPHLEAQPYSVSLTVTSDRYVTQDVEVPIGIDLQYPKRFVPPALKPVFLHREPTVISGRTVEIKGSSTVPLAGATVRITGIWRTPPPANVTVPPSAPDLVSLRPPLYADRKALVAQLLRRNIPPIAGDKTLLQDVLPGIDKIRLSDRQSLLAGDILLIDAGEPDLAEFVAIKTVPTAASSDQPAIIELDHLLVYEHKRNAVVQRTFPEVTGAGHQFSADALRRDTCVFLNGSPALPGATEVELNGGSPNEYHSLKRFTVTSDLDGYYRLPPLSRVAQVLIEGKKIVGPQTFIATVEFRPDYSKRENALDLTLTL